jgi:hypothetical protein
MHYLDKRKSIGNGQDVQMQTLREVSQTEPPDKEFSRVLPAKGVPASEEKCLGTGKNQNRRELSSMPAGIKKKVAQATFCSHLPMPVP